MPARRPCPAPAVGLTRWRLPLAVLLVVLAGSGLTACQPPPSAPGGPSGTASETASASASPAAPAATAAATSAATPAAASAPPVAVTLVTVQPRRFDQQLEATGTVTAWQQVEVKPQVSAQIARVHVAEGQTVRQGQLLFTLDARADEARLAQAQAQVRKDEALLADARRQLARQTDLLARGFVSQGAVDTALAALQAQQATLAADQAALAAAQVQLGYSRIVAPSAGRVGAIGVYPGSTVAPGGAALLTITQIHPVAVAFSLPQRHLPQALQALQTGPAARAGAGQVLALLPSEAAGATGAAGAAAAGAPRRGRLVFVDSAVDADSGTVKVKAQFDNTDQALWPGAFVTVRMVVRSWPEVPVLPLAAVVQNPRGTSVFVQGADGRAELRPVQLLASAGSEGAFSGLRAGERVVLDGRQNLRPGARLVVRSQPPRPQARASEQP